MMRLHVSPAAEEGHDRADPADAALSVARLILAMGAWTRLRQASEQLSARIEGELKSRGLPPVIWHDALQALKRAGEGGLRMYELQDELGIRQYNASRLVERMAIERLVARRRPDDDRRGQVLTITEAGRRKLDESWPVYRQAVERHVMARLDEAEAERLAELMEKLAE